MAKAKSVGSVTYQDADRGYFEKRQLKRHARIWSLWALGVGAVISGQFSGWNLGIASGGWGGLAIAAAIIAVMYLGLSFSLAEMSPALPHTGGAYSFARSAMGLVPGLPDRRHRGARLVRGGTALLRVGRPPPADRLAGGAVRAVGWPDAAEHAAPGA
jgi:amino acid transporter